ncbi:MAG TPA: DUF3459 domain-containing protein, partial [Candidatus Dormibacteraeota bacterium]|nr:DUF3459 domain-containing protein [Candidatus Dormibacteraeota bacterium]
SGGYGLDGVWADDFHHAVHTALTGERTGYYADFDSLAKTGKALRQAWVYDGQWSSHRRRTRGAKPQGLAPHQLVVAAQNHDQVGNRPDGERLCALVDTGRAKAAAALLLTSPFTPLLFQGEEWAASSPFQYFTDHRDPELARQVSEGRRAEFAGFGRTDRLPDPQDPATFARSKLRWEEVDESPHREMLEWYRELIALRRRLPSPSEAVGEGIDVTVDEGERHIDFSRPGVRVLVNLGTEEWNVQLGGEKAVTVPPSAVAVMTP